MITGSNLCRVDRGEMVVSLMLGKGDGKGKQGSIHVLTCVTGTPA